MASKTIDHIDFDRVNLLLEDFNKLTGFVTAVLDIDGRILSQSGWREICTKFHRVHPITNQNCIVSDTILANQSRHSDYNLYTCKNGLSDLVVPIIIDGEHVANLFTGQFFLKEPDVSFFEQQAAKYGFDKDSYLKALKDVPVVSESEAKDVAKYLWNVTKIIVDLTKDKIDQIEIEERMRLVLDNTNSGIYAVDENYFCTYVNKHTLKLLGYDKEEELLGKQMHELVHHSDIHGNHCELENCFLHDSLKFGKIVNKDDIIWKKDGTFIRVSYTSTPQYIDNKIIGTVVTFKDISQEEAIEEELKEYEERYKSLYDSMSQGLAIHEVILDENGHVVDYVFLDINDSYEKLVGVKKEDVIGKRVTEVMPGVEHYWIENYAKVVESGIPSSFENYFETTKKYYRTYSFRTKPNQFAVLVTDITQLQHMIEDLKLKEKSLLESQRIAHVGTWRLDIKTNKVVWTEELYKMYGFDPNLPVPDYTEHMKLFTPESWEKLSSSLARTSSEGVPYELELKTVTKEGNNGWMWVRGEAEKDAEGNIIAIWGAAQDITERIKTLNLLKESESRLDMFFQQALTGFFIMMIDEPVYWNDNVDKEKILDYIFDHQRCTRVNQAMLDQYNMKLEDFLQKTPREMFAHNIKEGKEVWRNMLDKKVIHTITDERKSDGTQIYIEGDYICMYDSFGRVIGHFGNQEDVTKRIQKQNEIEYLSNHDYLTDLYNRRYFFEQFKNLDNEKIYPLGVMMIDVNGLKIINDAFGHSVGDYALKTIGQVLKNSFEQKDIVSRIGGDEFAVLLPKSSLEDLQQYKDKLKDSIKKQRIENIEMSLAIGYELKTDPNDDIDELLKLAENHMYRHKSSVGSSVRNRAISAILETLTDKYEVEREHSKKVSHFCKLIGQHLKLRTDELKELEQAGMFHDIGKISIPDSVLIKPEKLTNEEYEIIKTHTVVGYQILRAADEYSDLAIHALHHHERWDGKGYPSGMKGNDIPLFSRIISVVDAYEAMTADRPYRQKLSTEYAISEIKKYSGTQFDPKIAKIFIEKVLKSDTLK